MTKTEIADLIVEATKNPKNLSEIVDKLHFIKNGVVEYAFPYIREGMTLRDYFAAKAMQSLIIKLEVNQESLIYDDKIHNTAPTLSYQIADAMLKERSK